MNIEDTERITGHKVGEVWKDEHGYFAITPNGMYCGLNGHNVIEHEDGTLTFSPSILVTEGEHRYHGYLEKSKWRTLSGTTKGFIE